MSTHRARKRFAGGFLVGLFTVLGPLAMAAPPSVQIEAPAPERPQPPPARANTVAVLYFDYAGADPAMAVLRKGLANMLISDLVAVPGVAVVERERLQAVLDEQKLSRNAKFDAGTAARVGRLLGARYLVLGAYFDLGASLRVDARVVEVETGKVVAATGTAGTLDGFLLVEQGLAKDLAPLLAGLPPMPAKVAPPMLDKKRPAPKPGTAERPERSVPAPPAKLPAAAAVQYAKALDLHDQGDAKGAQRALQAVVAAQPDFQLAARDLARMMR